MATLAPFRDSLFSFVTTPGLSELLIGVLAALGVMFNKVIADAVLDRFYHHFYGEALGKWESTTSNPWLFFPRGLDLKEARGRMRRYFIEHDTCNDYAAKDDKGRFIEMIYRPVMHHIEGSDPGVYRAVQAELSWSKTTRNSVLPLAVFALSVATQGSLTVVAVLVALAVPIMCEWCFGLAWRFAR